MRRFYIFSVLLLLLLGCRSETENQALGTLERDRITLLSTSNEIVKTLPFQEGAFVQKGDIIVQLDDARQQAFVRQASANVNKAKSYLEKLQNGERIEDIQAAKANLESAQATKIDAEKTFQRVKQMVEKKLSPPSDLDNALAQRDSSLANWQAAQQNWQKLSQGYREEDIKQAKADLEAAKAELAIQQHDLNQLTIKATRDGILDSLPYNQGERVPNNATVAIIQAQQTPYARVYIPEPYRAHIRPQQSFQVKVDGIEHTYSGKLRWISVDPAFTPYENMSEADRSRLVYLAEITLSDNAKSLPSGVPVQVQLDEHQSDH